MKPGIVSVKLPPVNKQIAVPNRYLTALIKLVALTGVPALAVLFLSAGCRKEVVQNDNPGDNNITMPAKALIAVYGMISKSLTFCHTHEIQEKVKSTEKLARAFAKVIVESILPTPINDDARLAGGNRKIAVDELKGLKPNQILEVIKRFSETKALKDMARNPYAYFGTSDRGFGTISQKEAYDLMCIEKSTRYNIYGPKGLLESDLVTPASWDALIKIIKEVKAAVKPIVEATGAVPTIVSCNILPASAQAGSKPFKLEIEGLAFSLPKGPLTLDLGKKIKVEKFAQTAKGWEATVTVHADAKPSKRQVVIYQGKTKVELRGDDTFVVEPKPSAAPRVSRKAARPSRKKAAAKARKAAARKPAKSGLDTSNIPGL